MPMPFALTLPAIALFSAAAITDLRSRRIPNLISLGLFVLGLVRVAGDLWSGAASTAAIDMGAAVAVLVLGAAAFHLRMLGGGDVKLLAAGALWLGAGALGTFLMTTALTGGVLAVAYLIRMRFFRPAGKEPGLPYGIAIAAGGILATAAPLWA